MRRITLALLVLAASPAAWTQLVWEKPIAPGLTYRQEVDLVRPRIVNALRLSLKGPVVHATPELAGKTIFEDVPPTGREPVSKIVSESGAIAGINADFFSMITGPSGNPLGLMVRRGELLTQPSVRVVVAWGPQDSTMGTSEFKGTVRLPSRAEVSIDGVNRRAGKNQVTLFTPAAAKAITDAPSVAVVLRMDNAVWAPSTQLKGTVESLSTEALLPVEEGKAVLVAQGTKQVQLSGLRPGDAVILTLETSGFDWTKVENAVGGGPFLVRDGKIAIDAEDEGFGATFSTMRHPRTAIGRTKEGDLWFVTVDGRQPGISVGATLAEMASLMLRLGCVEAANLDGGGSTTMNVFGLTVNRPSGGIERAVANAVLFYGPKPADETPMRLILPARISIGTTAQAKVVRTGIGGVPNTQILWGAQGSAWIDQGGVLHPVAPGPCTVSAAVGGQVLSVKVTVAKG